MSAAKCIVVDDAGKAFRGILQFGMYPHSSTIPKEGLWQIFNCLL